MSEHPGVVGRRIAPAIAAAMVACVVVGVLLCQGVHADRDEWVLFAFAAFWLMWAPAIVAATWASQARPRQPSEQAGQ